MEGIIDGIDVFLFHLIIESSCLSVAEQPSIACFIVSRTPPVDLKEDYNTSILHQRELKYYAKYAMVKSINSELF